MRLFGKLLATVVILLLLAASVLLTVLHTLWAPSLLASLSKPFSDKTWQARDIRYHISDPWHIEIIKPTLADRQGCLIAKADHLSLWLNPLASLTEKRWQFDSLLVDRPQLGDCHISHTEHTLPVVSARLAIRNAEWHSDELTLKGGGLELDNWQWQPNIPLWKMFSGRFRLSASEIQWQHQHFRDILLDGSLNGPDDWQINGLSLHWQHAEINGQIARQGQHFTLGELIVTGLQLQDSASLDRLTQQLQQLASSNATATIERLDILDSSLELDNLTLNHANLSLSGWQWPRPLFDQPNATLSFSAENGQWQQIAFTSPLIDLRFAREQVSLEGGSVSLLDGFIRASGTATPDSLLLDQFSAKGIRAFLPGGWQRSLTAAISHLNELRIAELDVGYAELTAADDTSPWQIKGFNATGHDLQLIHLRHPGLWQGDLILNAGFATVNQIPLSEPYLEMQGDNGQWRLTQAIVPFENGMLEGHGAIHLAQEERPWQLDMKGDSLPAAIFPKWLGIPLPVKGYVDIAADANGLGKSRSALAHSLSGNLTASFRDLYLDQAPQQLWQQWGKKPTVSIIEPSKEEPTPPTAVSLSPLKISGDRGRLILQRWQLETDQIKAVAKGEWDMATPAEQQLELDATIGCQRLSRRWQADQDTVELSSCNGKSI